MQRIKLRKLFLFFSLSSFGFLLLLLLALAGVFYSTADFGIADDAKKLQRNIRLLTEAGKNVRKFGEISVDVSDPEVTKESLKGILLALDGHILNERIEIALGNRQKLFYKVKVPADRFSTLIAKTGELGSITAISIEAEDISTEAGFLDDRLDELNARHYQNSKLKSIDAKVNDKLIEEISEIQRKRSSLLTQVKFSYLDIKISESHHLLTSIFFGIEYGYAGFHWCIRILIIVFLALLPLVSIFILTWTIRRFKAKK